MLCVCFVFVVVEEIGPGSRFLQNETCVFGAPSIIPTITVSDGPTILFSKTPSLRPSGIDASPSPTKVQSSGPSITPSYVLSNMPSPVKTSLPSVVTSDIPSLVPTLTPILFLLFVEPK